jgi:hypothetical protein
MLAEIFEIIPLQLLNNKVLKKRGERKPSIPVQGEV